MDEVRRELNVSPDGLPLVFVAPKQATFQIERQVLSTPGLKGFTRLEILSFERLAAWVLEKIGTPAPRSLSTQGRMMVLRSLIMELEPQLKVFRSSCHAKGFASQMGNLFAELVQYRVKSDDLDEAIKCLPLRSLKEKVHDVALILREYRRWKTAHELIDPEEILQFATEALVSHRHSMGDEILMDGLWMDGFAEMTKAETEFLATVVKHSKQATMAFCLPAKDPKGVPWHSSWHVVAQSFRQLRNRLRGDDDVEVKVESLRPKPRETRFADSNELAHLEKYWTKPSTWVNTEPLLPPAINLVACNRPETEAIAAARAILAHVKDGGRYRDCAVIVRSLEGCHSVLRKVFEKYQIPFFMDRRQPISHHPLTELTRSALRLAAYDWQHEDWFSVLKTGLAEMGLEDVDALENEASAHGWKRSVWLKDLNAPEKASDEKVALYQRWNAKRADVVGPLQRIYQGFRELDFEPTGAQVCQLLTKVWDSLKVEEKLRDWSSVQDGEQVHETVWNELVRWLENVERALADRKMPLREWLHVLDAGLDHLTVGVVPPLLDQVMIGAIDRSRNPDLKLAIVMGLNEGQFPASPGVQSLLTDADRKELSTASIHLSSDRKAQIGRERFYGYIAFTRSREKVLATWSEQGASGKEARPSSFVGQLLRMYPDKVVQHFSEEDATRKAVTETELRPRAIRLWREAAAPRPEAPEPWHDLLSDLEPAMDGMASDGLDKEWAAALYGNELKGSVSRLEQFGQCPFQFFVSVGLKAQERVKFEVDVRERGNFQHEVLQLLHPRIRESGRRWHDVSPDEAEVLVEEIATELRRTYKDGLFEHEEQNRFDADQIVIQLKSFVRTIFGWMNTYQLEPEGVEIPFGTDVDKGSDEESQPAWTIVLEGGQRIVFRGVIDRVDTWENQATGDVFFSIMDYKSSGKKVDQRMQENGIQIQLPAYAKALLNAHDKGSFMPGKKLTPAGFFYLNLRGSFGSVETREDLEQDPDGILKGAYKHEGHLCASYVDLFDKEGASSGKKSKQFGVSFKKDGSVSKQGNTAVPTDVFQEMLESTEEKVKEMGNQIFSGAIEVSPYMKGREETACKMCDYKSVCRFNSWVQPYRVLKKREKAQESEEASE